MPPMKKCPECGKKAVYLFNYEGKSFNKYKCFWCGNTFNVGKSYDNK